MKKLVKWIKGMSTQERMMLIFIVLLVAAIITRWGYIKSEAGEAFRQRFDTTEQTPPDTTEN